jgi:hypothetical protein
MKKEIEIGALAGARVAKGTVHTGSDGIWMEIIIDNPNAADNFKAADPDNEGRVHLNAHLGCDSESYQIGDENYSVFIPNQIEVMLPVQNDPDRLYLSGVRSECYKLPFEGAKNGENTIRIKAFNIFLENSDPDTVKEVEEEIQNYIADQKEENQHYANGDVWDDCEGWMSAEDYEAMMNNDDDC